VGDGVCDCCDGSDELLRPPPRSALPAATARAAARPRCSDTCAAARDALATAEARRARALARRAAMVEAAARLRAAPGRRGAWARSADSGDADGALLALAACCFKFETGEQTVFELCPFANASQYKAARLLARVGTSARWAERGVRMELRGGARCANRRAREASVRFECGDDDAIVAVSEPELCAYSVRFATPAACGASPPAVRA
jgi:protein kinase C substrate 80K-H